MHKNDTLLCKRTLHFPRVKFTKSVILLFFGLFSLQTLNDFFCCVQLLCKKWEKWTFWPFFEGFRKNGQNRQKGSFFRKSGNLTKTEISHFFRKMTLFSHFRKKGSGQLFSENSFEKWLFYKNAIFYKKSVEFASN
jgi:hypothetical protein